MMIPDSLLQSTRELSGLLRARGRRITTVESCTGGLVGACITALPGSSDIYPGGFISYSNELKQRVVGVSTDTLVSHGAVSAQTGIEMAVGGLQHTQADLAIAITGIAGPDGGSQEKPVGTVWICIASREGYQDCRRFIFPGDRDQVRAQSADASMRMAIQALEGGVASLPHEAERWQG